tara:strand:- start:118 stop:741 length:624 start_codon:yes stop_codon:yes gene_type:complete
LSDDWLAALEFTDHFILTPGPISKEMRNSLQTYFSEHEIAELCIGVALFHGFSKMLIALGREPEEMDTTIVPTPHLPESSTVESGYVTNDFSHLFTYLPDMESRWAVLEQSLLSLDALPEKVLSLSKHRMSQVLGVVHAASEPVGTYTDDEQFIRSVSESFVFDIRSIASSTRERIIESYGSQGLLQLMFGMALYDGIFRMEALSIA